MTQEERRKKISTLIASVTCNPVYPSSIREGLAAVGEELRELGRRVEDLETEKQRGQ